MRRILLLTGCQKGDVRTRMGDALRPLGTVDVQDMHRQRQRLGGGHYDVIVFDTRYASHNMEEKMRATYPGVRVIRTQGGPGRLCHDVNAALTR